MGQVVAAEFCCSSTRPGPHDGAAPATGDSAATSAATPPQRVADDSTPETGTASRLLDSCGDARRPPALESDACAPVSPRADGGSPRGQTTPSTAPFLSTGADTAASCSLLVVEDSRPVWDVYMQGARRGCGPFGAVFEARDRATGAAFAMKKIELASRFEGTGEAISEFRRCAQVSHPNIAKVFSFFNTGGSIYIVSELASKGDIWDFMSHDLEQTKEVWISEMVAQVLSGLIYLHQLALVHAGVKPSNILVTDQHLSWDPSVPVVVLADTGLAHLHLAAQVQALDEPQLLCAGWYCGPAEYCPPEAIEGRLCDRTDVYALGATLHELLSGVKPPRPTVEIIMADGALSETFASQACIMGEPVRSHLQSVSSDGQALVRWMMAVRPEDRPSAVEAAVDPWFGANDDTRTSAGVPEEEAQVRVTRLQHRARQCTFAKELINMMAAQLSGDMLQKERELFQEIDKDGSGFVTVDELLRAFEDAGGDRARAAAAMAYFGTDASGSLSFNQWVAATMDLQVDGPAGLMSRARSIFAQLDIDGNGTIEYSELRDRFGGIAPDQESQLVSFFSHLDSDNDGVISRLEFEQFWINIA